MLKALIFDFDGLFADTEPIHVRSWQALFAEMGAHAPESLLALGVGLADVEFAAVLRKELKLDASPERITERKFQLYNKLVLDAALPPSPGAMELVEYGLSKGLALAIASNSFREGLTLSLKRALQCAGVNGSLNRYFSVLVSGDEVRNRKPAPDIYKLALSRLAVAPREAVAFEDSIPGAEAALAAGLRCIVCPHQLTRDRRFPDAVVRVNSLLEVARSPSILEMSAAEAPAETDR